MKKLETRLHARARRRREERGAAVFVVVLVLTLITAIGVFSMRAAGLVDLATGFNRQNVQASFLAEFAVRATASYLSDNPRLLDDAERPANCAPALLAADPQATCYPLESITLTAAYNASAPQTFSDGLTGMLSVPGNATQVQANLSAELTEPGPASTAFAPGFEVGTPFRQVTVTSRARVFPTGGGATQECSAGSRESLSQQIVRAHVIVPELNR